MLPPSVPEWRTRRPAKRLAKGCSYQRGIRIGQRDSRANQQMLRLVFSPAQLGHLREVDDLVELPVLLGQPQPHIGAARDKLCFRVRSAKPEQFSQRWRQFISQIGLLRTTGVRKQLQFR